MTMPALSLSSAKGIVVFVVAVLIANYVLSQVETTRLAAGLNKGSWATPSTK